MRILRVVTRLNAGGPTRHAVWANAGLAARGHQVLLAAGRVESGEDDLSNFAARLGVEVVSIPGMSRTPHARGDLSAVTDLRRLVRRFRPEVVHTHTAKAGTLGRLAVALARVPPQGEAFRVFHTFHGHSLTGYFTPLASVVFRGVEAVLARLATDRVVALSPLQRSEIARLLRLPPARIVIVPNALDLAAFETLPSRGDFRRELGLPEGKFLWGAVGRIAPVKNYAQLVTVACLLRERSGHAAPAIVVVGGGEGLEGFRQRVRDEGLEGRLVFCGPRFDLPQIYADLDGVVLCSHQEGTPLSLIEATVCGLPIVATAVGGVPDLLLRTFAGGLWDRRFYELERPRGALVRPGDAGELALQLAERPPRRAPEASSSVFRLPRLLDDLEALYGGEP
jgi:glycosyltransferase involved in cell wall biosynthesis